jgi:hypothetical protein
LLVCLINFMNLINARIIEQIKPIKHYLFTKRKQVRKDTLIEKLSPSLWTPTYSGRLKKIRCIIPYNVTFKYCKGATSECP